MDGLDEALGGDLRPVLELAALAPSVHNTQPWRFHWDGAALHVFEDPSRALAVLDPAGRERIISCGGAALNARLGLAELGYGCRTSLCPDPAQPELLATLTVLDRRTPTDQERRLAEAIPRRTTDRDPFDPRRVPDDVRPALRLAAEEEGGWLRFLGPDGANDSVELQILLSHADDSQRSDPAYLEELAAWRRDREAEGVPSRALPSVPAELRATTWVGRDFDAATPHGHVAAAGGEPLAAEHPAVLVVGTEGDSRKDWLVAGQALCRVLLLATVEGLAAQPLTQVLEVPILRARMRHALGVVGHPQMLMRIGYGHARPTSRRRPVEEFTTIAST